MSSFLRYWSIDNVLCTRRKKTYINAATIVSDLQELQAPILDQNLNRGRPSIHSIFDQLLESVHRCYNDLSCRDLIDDILGQCLHETLSPVPLE